MFDRDDELEALLAFRKKGAASHKKAALRDLGRTVMAGLTASGAMKGAVYAGVAGEMGWCLFLSMLGLFWVVGLWRWKELE